MWIGNPWTSYKKNNIGFLIEIFNSSNRGLHMELREYPALTNISREPKLFGWCGETNNESVTALGVWKVVRVARNGRAQIRELCADELKAALDILGYPELYHDA